MGELCAVALKGLRDMLRAAAGDTDWGPAERAEGDSEDHHEDEEDEDADQEEEEEEEQEGDEDEEEEEGAAFRRRQEALLRDRPRKTV